ncbi:RNA polymerase subunit sigma [Microbacterium sp. SS28]|uniref:DUF7882 family protein n=1 Tax=Microbacterium sp. SS28 TaxID=2919948 RepID=UPI001FA96811|nr:RNA polymerase subunit sigma [Microbacterium sp. SS28]
MGRLYYGMGTDGVEIPDRVLSHLKVVTSSKLRRSESFTVTFKNPYFSGSGRTTIWVHCSIPLRFEFESAESEQLDRDYLNQLAQAATSTNGIVIDLTEVEEEVSLKPTLVRAA